MNSDILVAIRELRELLKNAVPSSKSGDTVPTQFVLTAGGPGTSKFSLPARCSWAALVSPGAFSFAFNSAASFSFIPVAAATAHVLAGNGPLDLSTLHIFVAAAASGATVTAWCQKAPDLA